MKAALLRNPLKPLTIEEVQPTELRDDEILVRLVGVGICHTDLAGLSGAIPLPLPAVLGHEGAGVVEKVGGGVSMLAVGDHVVLTFGNCGGCASCSAERPAYCELFGALNYFGTRLDSTATLRQGESDVHGSWFSQSSFASHAIATAHNAVKVDASLPLELVGPLGCGLQTGAGTVLNVLKPQAGQGIGIWGLGAVGLAAVMAAQIAGCDPIVAVDINAERLALACELGATHTIDGSNTADVVWDILQISGGLHYSVDAVGLGSAIREALSALRSPGVCATLGLQGLENDVTIDQGHLLLGRTLTGVIEGDVNPHTFIPELARYWRDGRFPFDRLVRTFPFEEINDAIAALRTGAVVKPVLTFN